MLEALFRSRKCQWMNEWIYIHYYIYVWSFRGKNMTYETKKILHFMRYVWKWVATLDVQELYWRMLQSRVHIVVVREIRARIGLVEAMCKAWSNMIKGRALYQSVIFRLSDLLRGKVCIADHSHHLCTNAMSHITMHTSIACFLVRIDGTRDLLVSKASCLSFALPFIAWEYIGPITMYLEMRDVMGTLHWLILWLSNRKPYSIYCNLALVINTLQFTHTHTKWGTIGPVTWWWCVVKVDWHCHFLI